MRKIYIFLLCSLFVSALCGQAVPELLYYNFNGVGTTVPNLASAPPTGTATATILGGITQGGNALCSGTAIGSGISASTDYVNTGWATNLTGSSWTISVRTKDFGSTAALYYIFGDNNAGGFRCFTNGVAGPNNWILRGTGINDVTVAGGAVAGATMTTFVYDMSLGNIKGYLNGVLVTTIVQTGTPTIAGAGPFKVVGYSTNIGAPAGGKLDEFRLYNRALNATEVLELYNPTYTGFLGADQLLCAGDTITLTGGGNSGAYNWSTGDTTTSITVDTVNTYSVSIAGLCGSGYDTIVVSAAPALPAPGFAGPDDTICVGDTLVLSVSTTDTILWSTGANTNTIAVTSPGFYTVAVTGYCGSARDTVRIDSSMLIYSGFAMADTMGGCEGDTIMLSSTGIFDSYLWSTGDTSATTWVTSGGSYAVSVMDGCGMGSDTITIAPFTVGANAVFTSSVNMMTASFTNGSTGTGTITYSWSFGDGNTSTQMSPTNTYAANGTYIVTLTVTNECGSSTTSDTIVINFVGVANPNNMQVNVFPNPAQDRVVVATDLTEIQDLQVSLVSIMGQVVLQQQFTNANGSFRQALDVNSLAAGVYFLHVESNAGKHVTRLVIE